VVCDRGTEFKGESRMKIRDLQQHQKLITTRNPQANAMVERVHKTINNYLRTLQMHLLSYDELHDKFDGYLSAVTKAINSTVHTTLNATPTQLGVSS
jgi:transposase InsO family protein